MVSPYPRKYSVLGHWVLSTWSHSAFISARPANKDFCKENSVSVCAVSIPLWKDNICPSKRSEVICNSRVVLQPITATFSQRSSHYSFIMALAKLIHQHTDLFGPLLLFQLITESRPPSLGSTLLLWCDDWFHFLSVVKESEWESRFISTVCNCQELQKCFT